VSPHGVLELSLHLAGAIPNALKVENIFGLSLYELGATTAPVKIVDGMIAMPQAPGHGVVFDGPALAAHEIIAGAAFVREAITHAGI
jgi:L-alanine-DL-glutamate epimerase-like enolase superfamily enzyme